MCSLGVAWGQYDFRATCPEGQMMYFKILADSATVRVTHPGPNWPYYDPEHRMHGSVTVPAEVEWQGRRYRVTEVSQNAFYRNDSLTAIHLPQVHSIGAQAFCGCTALREINIPDGVTEMGDGVFAYCRSLQTLEIPLSVQRIGTSAFALCSGLQLLKIGAALFARTDGTTFQGCTRIDEGKNVKKCADGSLFLFDLRNEGEILCR